MWTPTAATVFSPLNISAPAQTRQCVGHWLLCLASLCVIFAPVPSINWKTCSFSWKKSGCALHSSMSQTTRTLKAPLMQRCSVTVVIKVFPFCFFTSHSERRTWTDGFRGIVKEVTGNWTNSVQMCTFTHSIQRDSTAHKSEKEGWNFSVLHHSRSMQFLIVKARQEKPQCRGSSC